MEYQNFSEWLKKECEKARLSLRQAGDKAGLSHATIQCIIKGGNPSSTTVRKLAQSFCHGGRNELMFLEEELLVLTGHKTKNTNGSISQPLACLLDSVKGFSEAELKIVSRFADFVAYLSSEGNVADVEKLAFTKR